MGIFDSHAHYQSDAFKEDLDELLSSMNENGVSDILDVICTTNAKDEDFSLYKKYPFMKTAIAVHPHDAGNVKDGYLEALEEVILREGCVALGEIGLDYHYNFAPKEIAKKVFREQMELAKKLTLPVIIHSREATKDTLEILAEYPCVTGVVHCFSGSAETAQKLIEMGYYISFTGVITFKNAQKAKKACAVVPLDKLLIETDCPYMAPEPKRGKRCDSRLLKYTAQVIAEIIGVSSEEIIAATNQNAKKLFKV